MLSDQFCCHFVPVSLLSRTNDCTVCIFQGTESSACCCDGYSRTDKKFEMSQVCKAVSTLTGCQFLSRCRYQKDGKEKEDSG